MSDGEVWISQAMHLTTTVKPLTSDIREERNQDFLQAGELKSKGLPIPEDLLATKLFANTPRPINSLPHFFRAGGYHIVSRTLADILRDFDLGETRLHPIEIYQFDRKTPVDGKFELLSIGERKHSFLPEFSEGARQTYGDDYDIWKLPGTVKEDMFSVSSAALSGPDLWMETPRLPRYFFLSGRLVEALKKAKINKSLLLHRCRVLAAN
ncbi:hypothetical protein K3X48_11350 [Aliiroseovarius crassostreae]|uniref:Uncharacterized protein n=1 Tax=Aliiroseovarius crassostreae TaxID=154981 RepID=A0A9Q9LUG4_9RHOB|nr:hypothetical protein [Aliiroseovarius crassostreae]UWP94801.1 hypothetical protein K3X48_11350 [Aliiroseovarius crassostreae]